MTTPPAIADAIARVPAGRWAVGVSGGADSVALLVLLAERPRSYVAPDLSLHVVHLDHETRAGASAADARFVAELADRLSIPCTIAMRSDVESKLGAIEANTSARFRAARLALFRQVVDANRLDGVILAHHAGDQAETVLHRLLRGGGAAGLAGMTPRTRVGGLLILRPLLETSREALCDVLRARGQSWRDDSSNLSDLYVRNRLRRLLSKRPVPAEALIRLGTACRELRDWVSAHTPHPDETLRIEQLLACAGPVRRELARRWLTTRAGVPADRVDAGVIARLIAMAQDAATPPRQDFPGKVRVCRARGLLTARGGEDG